MLSQVDQGILKIGGSSNCVLRIDFSALPSGVSWDLEEATEHAGGADAAPDAVHAPIRKSTLESDTLKRMDIYGCS